MHASANNAEKGVCVSTAQAALSSEGEEGGTAGQAMAAQAQAQQQLDECDVQQGKREKSGTAGPAMAARTQAQKQPDECDLQQSKGEKNGAADLLKKLAKYCVSAVKENFENFDLSNISRDKNLTLLKQHKQ